MVATPIHTTTQSMLYQVWRLLPNGRWGRAGRYGTRAAADYAIPERRHEPGWLVLPVSAKYLTAARV
ncbi:unnamed protein product [Gemmata massiliana]|uniref:Uncharacterized protein n=1 Tax=Gemmata massiliana TaxID=1210884 RepID=A0A6P2DAF5_9BACT|nr:hypothetical protein [Gemmata massiliana]VTR97913.1 unnamed protein product [Gemmata massiliana]